MSKAKTTKQQHEELGKAVVAVYETGYLDAGRSFKMSFLKGLAQGLGGIIGATILAAVLLWVLSFFDQVPILGRFVDNVQQTMDAR